MPARPHIEARILENWPLEGNLDLCDREEKMSTIGNDVIRC